MWKKISWVTGIVLFVGAIIGGAWKLDDRNEEKFARADDLLETKIDLKDTKVLIADSLKEVNQSIQKTNVRIQQYALQDQAVYIKRQMAEIRSDCKTSEPYRMPEDARKRYNEYKIQLDIINNQMKTISE